MRAEEDASTAARRVRRKVSRPTALLTLRYAEPPGPRRYKKAAPLLGPHFKEADRKEIRKGDCLASFREPERATGNVDHKKRDSCQRPLHCCGVVHLPDQNGKELSHLSLIAKPLAVQELTLCALREPENRVPKSL